MRRPEDFRLAVRRGRRAAGPALVVHLLGSRPVHSSVHTPVDESSSPAPAEAARPEQAPLVGFVVPRSVGGAVVRNQVARRLRHLLRARLDRLPAGSRVVVRALPPAAAAGSAELAAHLDDAIGRLAARGPR